MKKNAQTILVTGGSGFIGSNFILEAIRSEKFKVINIDALTYAANQDNLSSVQDHPLYKFIKCSINDRQKVRGILLQYQPEIILNFAAESHVDRSILGAGDFISTNIVGTYELLEATREYYSALSEDQKINFRFIHISTDEVYGSLSSNEKPSTEQSVYKPNSPYAASKAASNHLARSFYKTYDLPVITTIASNNYGPYQFPEKLIPLVILNALSEKFLPVYGDGSQIRDWLHVQDHVNALFHIINNGKIGKIYNIGGNIQMKNLDLVHLICKILDEIKPRGSGSYRQLIKFVADRPGHDTRYNLDTSVISEELGWHPAVQFEQGLKEAIGWYLRNQEWLARIQSKEYLNWVEKNYSGREKAT